MSFEDLNFSGPQDLLRYREQAANDFLSRLFGGAGGGSGGTTTPPSPTPTAPPIAGYDILTQIYAPAAGINPGADYANPYPALPAFAPPPANVPNTTQASTQAARSPYGGYKFGLNQDQSAGFGGPSGYVSPVSAPATPGFGSRGNSMTEDVLYGTPQPERGRGSGRTGRQVGGVIGGLLGGPVGGLLGVGAGHLIGQAVGGEWLPPTVTRKGSTPTGGERPETKPGQRDTAYGDTKTRGRK